ncbi:MAG: glycosyltransferase family 2 protein [Chthoniobacterales bacterium]
MDKPTAPVWVSVIVPIKNESENLPRCLASVAWAGEIFVVDSESSDGSQEIAQKHGAEVVQFAFNGTWPILDADEVLPPAAEAEFRKAIAEAGTSAGYWINRRFMFMGRWLRHAYYPNWSLRLFRHLLGRYEKLTEMATASGDNEVHEHVVVQGPTGRLRCEMDHYASPSVEVFVEKHNRYSNWEARVAVAGEKAGTGLQSARVAQRRRLELLSKGPPFRPLLRFLYVYFWQRGFLDGVEGYYFARLHAFYEFLSVAKTHELRK